MNIQKYMINPMGSGSSVLMLPELRKSLDIQYQSLVSKITMTWYSFQDKYYIAHVKIPSRTIDKLFYDVLIEMDRSSIPESSTVINGGNARVFSNCPSFTFTYAKVFNDKGDLIPWTKEKYNAEVFINDPVKRNPMKISSYERSIYFAIKFITTNGRNYKNRINLHIHKVNSHTEMLNLLKSSDDIIHEYQMKKKKQDDQKKNIVNPSKEPHTERQKNLPQKKRKQGVKKTPITKTSKKTSKTNNTKHTKRV